MYRTYVLFPPPATVRTGTVPVPYRTRTVRYGTVRYRRTPSLFMLQVINPPTMSKNDGNGGLCHHPELKQQQRKSTSFRIVRHIVCLLILTLAIITTSSCASANYQYVKSVLPPAVSREPGQEVVSIIPNGQGDVPVKILLRGEDLITVPSGTAKRTSVQIINIVSLVLFK